MEINFKKIEYRKIKSHIHIQPHRTYMEMNKIDYNYNIDLNVNDPKVSFTFKKFKPLFSGIIKCDDSNIKQMVESHYHELHLLDVSRVTDMSGLFSGKKDIKGIEDWDVSGVRNMSFMFQDCENVKSNLSNWNVSNVTDMSSMFENCKDFNCDLSNWNVSNVVSMNSMFCHCFEFNSNLSNWNVRKVTDMRYMFLACKKFNSDLSRWNVSNVIDMRYMFAHCFKLNSDFEKWNVKETVCKESMFQACNNIDVDSIKWYNNQK